MHAKEHGMERLLYWSALQQIIRKQTPCLYFSCLTSVEPPGEIKMAADGSVPMRESGS